MNIEINTPFPIEWDKTYYSVGESEKNVYAPCVTCDNTGKVTIKGEEYTCPNCHGNWRNKEIISKKTVYSTEKYQLSGISIRNSINVRTNTKEKDVTLYFSQINAESSSTHDTLAIEESCFYTMAFLGYANKFLTDDLSAVQAEVRRLNAEEKAKGGKV
jgi:predicted RNA-binding Zn-ribbon protein involved in translation (DUF1610 family)